VLADIISSALCRSCASRGVRQAAKAHHHQCPSHQPGLDPRSEPTRKQSDFYFVQAEAPEIAVGRIIELVKTRIPRRFGLDPHSATFRALSDESRWRRCPLVEHRAAGSASSAGDNKVERFRPGPSRPATKVMQIENDYDKEVYNGDIGLSTT